MSSALPRFTHALIVGGGFAGVAVLLQLLRKSRQPLHITIAEPREQLGFGVAYSTENLAHLLNGPARFFSALEDDPLHFVRWLQAQVSLGGWQPPAGVALSDSTPPRKLYGDYVRATLVQALSDAGERVSLRHLRQRVVGIDGGRHSGIWQVQLADGETLEAGHVVLATGVFPRRKLPVPHDAQLLDSPRYVPDAWERHAFDGVASDQTVAFLGTGLTALDALINAEQAGFGGHYVAFSRRGQSVQPRREVTPWPDFLQYDTAAIRVRHLLRQINRERRLLRRQGQDWQRLVPAIKAHVVPLWANAPEREKRLFLSRLRPYWEAALHRSAAQALAWQDQVQQQGRYRQVCGKITGLRLDPSGKIAIEYHTHTSDARQVLLADRLVNCLGFEFDWQKTDDALLTHLLNTGLVQPDPLGFGIQVHTDDLCVLDAQGQPQIGLHAIGHPLRGSLWESNAIPEQVPQAGLIARLIDSAISPLARARALAPVLRGRAEQADRDNQLSLENLDAIRAAGLAALAVPRRLGGLEQRLADVVAVIGELGRSDPSSALIILMQTFHHRWILGSPNWPAHLRETVLAAAVTHGDLINALRVEPVLGSPVRGGLPATVARRVPQGWLLNGRKIYSTGAQALRWGLVWAATDEVSPRVGEFLVPMQTPGVRIEQTWDHLGLRGSGSHDVVFEDVLLPDDHGADLRLPAQWSSSGDELGAWLPLMLAALYDGVARNARDWLVDWSRQRRPGNLPGSLAELPRFRSSLGEMDALLLGNAALLDQLARDSDGPAAGVNAGLVKYSVTRNAIVVVNQALALAGNHGLTRHNPLERHLRDVLCSRVHHPQDDLILDKAGRFAFAA